MRKAGYVACATLMLVCINVGAAKNKEKEISCLPRVLYPGDTLKIKTSLPFTYLGVLQPKKKAQTTLLISPGSPGQSSPGMMSSEQFAQTRRLSLPINTTTINTTTIASSNGGEIINPPLFQAAGSYVFSTGNDMSVGSSAPVFKCIVKYVAY